MNEILQQITDRGLSNEVSQWFEKRLPQEQEAMSLTKAEHILDWIEAKKPAKLFKMRWDEALSSADKWTKAEQKKGAHIQESKKDTKFFMEIGKFKIVELVGEAAYKREGHLMSHCVASYYDKSEIKVYSLRDAKNEPHATFEVVGEDQVQQVKGKGNGAIHPNYIDAVVQFLKKLGMPVRDSEMLNLGYVNIEKLLPDIGNIKDLKEQIFNKKYLRKDARKLLKDTDGNELLNLDVLDIFPLIEDTANSIKIAFDIPLLVKASFEWIQKKCKTKNPKNEKAESGGDSSQLAGGNSSQLAGGDSSQLAGGYYSQLAGGYSSKLAGGNSSQLAGGYSSQLAGGNYSQLAGGYYSKLIIGAHGIALGDHQSQAKGKIGAAIVLCEREEVSPYKIVAIQAVIIDGKKIKEDTWYTLKNGQIVEVQ